ncbi:MAG: DUF2878 domain-containing protein [Gemmatimonadales bacterium]
MKSLALNLVLYKIGWVSGVTTAAAGYPAVGMTVIGGLIVVHCWLATAWRGELRLVVACGALGFLVDSFQTGAGVLNFPSSQSAGWLAPAWIVMMWMQMGTTLRYCLRFLQGRYRLAAVLGALGGPLSFAAGERMGAVILHPNPWVAMGSLAVTWGLAMPLMTWIASQNPELLHSATYGRKKLSPV